MRKKNHIDTLKYFNFKRLGSSFYYFFSTAIGLVYVTNTTLGKRIRVKISVSCARRLSTNEKTRLFFPPLQYESTNKPIKYETHVSTLVYFELFTFLLRESRCSGIDQHFSYGI